MADCYDGDGNIIPCDKIKSSWKKSTDISKGTEMKEIYKPSSSAKKDPKVYDKLQAELDSGFAKAKYGFEGSDLNKYVKAKRTDTIYRSPSKDKKQTETLERINKREGSVFVDSTPQLRTIEIHKDPSGSDGRQKQSTMKQKPDSSKRSLDFNNITVSGNPPPMSSTKFSVSCPTWRCAERRAQNKQKKIDDKNIKKQEKSDLKEQRKSERNMPKNRTPVRKFTNSSTQRKSSKWSSGAGIKRNVRSLFS